MKLLGPTGALLFFVTFTISSCHTLPSPKNAQIISSNQDIAHVGQLETATVVSCHDGDTCTLTTGVEKVKVRFACTDSREIRQPGGIADRDYLRSLLSKANNQVKLEGIKQDRYGRTVGELWIDQGQGWELVQKLMAERGHGFAYHQYKNDCKSWDTVLKAEEKARQKRLGVWAISNPQPPWEWRRQNR